MSSSRSQRARVTVAAVIGCLLFALASYAGEPRVFGDQFFRSTLDKLRQMPSSPSMEERRISCSIASLPFPRAVDEVEAEQNVLHARVRVVLRQTDSLCEEGDYAGAVAALEAFLPTATESSMRSLILERLGACHFDAGNYGEALRYMEQVDFPLLSPAAMSQRCNTAAVLIAMNKPKAAVDLLAPVAGGHAEDQLEWAICFNMACALSLLENRESALSYLRRAHVADPLATRLHSGDPHLDHLREEPQFVSMTSGEMEDKGTSLPRWQGLGVSTFDYEPRKSDEGIEEGRSP